MKSQWFYLTLILFYALNNTIGQEKMEVEGAIKIEEAQNADDGTIEYNSSLLDFRGRVNGDWKSLTNLWSEQTSSTNIFYNSGNVGIGTSTPLAKFHLKGTSSIGILDFGPSGYLSFYNGSSYKGFFGMWTGGGMGADDIQLSTSNGNTLGKVHLATKTTPKLTIDPDGHTGIGTTMPSQDALLDVKSTTDGVLIPRMTNAERDAIESAPGLSPSTGLLIYSTDSNSFWYFDGTTWIELGSGSGSPTAPSPAHLNQPASLSRGIAFNTVDTYKAHYADNGDAFLLWKDSGTWHYSYYTNGEWCHPLNNTNNTLAEVFSSDMNNSGKLVFTSVSGTNINVYELTSTGSTLVQGPIATGISSPSPQISLNDNGNYFVSYKKDLGGQDHVYVFGNNLTTPVQVSTFGTDATEHRISYSENDDAVIFWEQPTSIGTEIGLYRAEYNGSTWTTMPGLLNYVDKSYNDFFDNIILRNINSSVDGQFLLLYDIVQEPNPGGSGTNIIHHKRIEKRSSAWNIFEFSYTDDEPTMSNNTIDIYSSMSDNGNSLITYRVISNFSSDLYLNKYDNSMSSWTTILFNELQPDFIFSGISNNQAVVGSRRPYMGDLKYYLSLDACNLSKLPNMNEGIGVDGSNVSFGFVDVINNGNFLFTWLQSGKLMYILN